MLGSHIKKLLNFVYVGVIVGFVSGLVIAALHISNNEYFRYRVYNLILFDLQQYITKYSIIFILLSLLALVLMIIIEKLDSWIGHHYPAASNYMNKRISITVLISLIGALVLAFICRYYASDILEYLRNSSLSDSLGKFSESRKDSRRIYTTLVNIVLISLSIFIVVRYQIIQRAIKRYYRIADNKAVKSIPLTILGLLVILNIFTFEYKSINTPEGMNVVLISIDTLRVDHLGSYGYRRDTTPNIDKLAEKGVLFENSYSQAPWTLPSMASMITSLYPLEHGVTHRRYKIRDKNITLAEYMKNNFYSTIAVISNQYLTAKYGFAQGFDIFDEELVGVYRRQRTSHFITDRAIEYLSTNGDNKFFLWIHYMDPHAKYLHHPEYGYSSNYTGPLEPILSPRELNRLIDTLEEEDIQYAKDLYDEEISFTDANIGRIFDTLDDLGRTNNTIIIITADHGEEFLDKTRFGHGGTLYQELIHVPLIIYVPSEQERGAKRVKSNVEVRSIAKTIVDLAGIQQNHLHGDNLLIKAEEDGENSIAYSIRLYGRIEFPESESIILDNWKLVKNLTNNSYELYDLETDPLEKMDLYGAGEDRIDIMKKDLISKLSGFKQEKAELQEEVNLSEEDIKQLKALGYIQ